MTKEAIRKREYRAKKESAEIKANRKAKDNCATKLAIAAETEEKEINVWKTTDTTKMRRSLQKLKWKN